MNIKEKIKSRVKIKFETIKIAVLFCRKIKYRTGEKSFVIFLKTKKSCFAVLKFKNKEVFLSLFLMEFLAHSEEPYQMDFWVNIVINQHLNTLKHE